MKAHIGVDAASGLTHSLTTTSANAHDITQADKLAFARRRVNRDRPMPAIEVLKSAKSTRIAQ